MHAPPPPFSPPPRRAGALAVALAGALWTVPAGADDWSTSLGASTDYVVRGISLNNSHGSVTLDGSYRGDTGWTAGLGLAALDRDTDGRRLLLTANVGRNWELDADWAVALGFNHAAYPGNARRRAYDSDEISATAAWRGLWTGSLVFSPNTTRQDSSGQLRTGRALSAELGVRQRLVGALALDAGLGYFQLSARPRYGYAAGTAGYPYGSLGLSWAAGPAQAYLSYIASRAHENGLASASRAGERWVASLLWEF